MVKFVCVVVDEENEIVKPRKEFKEGNINLYYKCRKRTGFVKKRDIILI